MLFPVNSDKNQSCFIIIINNVNLPYVPQIDFFLKMLTIVVLHYINALFSYKYKYGRLPAYRSTNYNNPNRLPAYRGTNYSNPNQTTHDSVQDTIDQQS